MAGVRKKRREPPAIWAEIGLSCCENAPMVFQVLLNYFSFSLEIFSDELMDYVLFPSIPLQFLS